MTPSHNGPRKYGNMSRHAAFWNVYALAEKKFGYGEEKKTVAGFSQKFTEKAAERYGTRIFIALTGLTILSLTAFLFEAIPKS